MLKCRQFIVSINIYIIFAQIFNKCNNIEDFENYAVDMDSDCLHQDFDDIDLYGNKSIDDSDDNYGDNLILDQNIVITFNTY